MLRRLLALALLALPALALFAQSDAAFVEWARARSVPMERAFPALDAHLAGVRVIGAGESVHENETFLAFRREMLQDLVRRHRVTALVLESGLPEAMPLDDYVRGRSATVDYDAALPGPFTGNLEEMRRTMEWLRRWNLGEGKARPVSVYGADLPRRSGSMVPALDRLEALTAGDAEIQALIASIRPTAEATSARFFRPAIEKYEALPAETKQALAADVERLLERVSALTKGDAERLAWARRLTQVIRQNEVMLRHGPYSVTSPREVGIADNILWVLTRLGPGERAVFWAHNAHIQKVPVKGTVLPPGQFPSAGMRLADALGEGYYAIATAYGGPSMDEKTEPLQESVDGVLGRVAPKPFLLPLPSASSSPAVDAWLRQDRPMRFQAKSLTLPLGGAFDAVAYFDRAVAASKVLSPPK
jgi:erythromycin esterase